MRIGLAILALLLLVPTTGLRAAEVYRYTDGHGVIHFVSSPDDVPARFRKRTQPVKGQVSRVSTGEPATAAGQSASAAGHSVFPGGLPLAGLLPDLTAALSPPLIVLVELWRSRLLFSLLGLAALVGLFILGLRFARDVPAGRRRRHRLRLCGSFAAVLVLFWLALFGPGLGRMFRGCEAESVRSLELVDQAPKRERLERFQRFSGRAAEAVERLLVTAPA